jgi:hypothetical protein
MAAELDDTAPDETEVTTDRSIMQQALDQYDKLQQHLRDIDSELKRLGEMLQSLQEKP